MKDSATVVTRLERVRDVLDGSDLFGLEVVVYEANVLDTVVNQTADDVLKIPG